MDTRYQTLVEKIIHQLILLISSKKSTSPLVNEMIIEIKQVLYAYLGLNMVDNVTPLKPLDEVALEQAYEPHKFQSLIQDINMIYGRYEMQGVEDEKLAKLNKKLKKILIQAL